MGPLKLSDKQLKPDPHYVDFVEIQGIDGWPKILKIYILNQCQRNAPNPPPLFRQGLDLISAFVIPARDIGTLS